MEAEEQRDKWVIEERAIMCMDPRKMDEKARQYWELTHRGILAKFGGGGGGNGGVDDAGASACNPL